MKARTRRLMAVTTGATLLLASGFGCSSTGAVAGRQAAGSRLPVHDATSHERVTVRLLTAAQWTADGDLKEITLPDMPREEAVKLDDRARGRSLSLVASVAGFAAGIVMDFVQEAIKREAATHERQYRQTVHGTDFWEHLGTPRYRGFVIERTATTATGERVVAARIAIAFIYNPDDPRMVLLKPVFVDIDAAKARVSAVRGVRSMDVKINTLLVGTQVDADGVISTQNLADATFVLDSFALDGSGPFRALLPGGTEEWTSQRWNEGTQRWEDDETLAHATAGFFLSPLPAGNPEDQVAAAETALANARQGQGGKTESQVREEAARIGSGGAFGLTVIVTETDRSKVAEVLVDIADFVGSQRDAVIKHVEGAINPPQQ